MIISSSSVGSSLLPPLKISTPYISSSLLLKPRETYDLLTSKHKASVAPFLRNEVLPPGARRNVLTDFHTSAVAVAVREMDANPNRVLNARSPPVDDSERSLPRHWRSTLTQLRSGFCRCLRSYKAVVDQSGPTVCPECSVADQTVDHLFECTSQPTTLYKLDLSVNPVHAVHFLSRLSSFSHLPRIPAPSSALNPHPVLHRVLPPPPPPPSPPPSLRHKTAMR